MIQVKNLQKTFLKDGHRIEVLRPALPGEGGHLHPAPLQLGRSAVQLTQAVV